MDQTKIEFEVEYSACPRSRFWRVGKGFIYFFVAVVGCWWLWSVGQYQRRNHAVDSANMPSGGLTLGYLFNILLLLGRLFVHVFFPLCFCLCSYWFVFFKMQSTAYALLPTENRHDGKDFEGCGGVRTLIISLWVTQTLVVFQLVYKQCTMEVLICGLGAGARRTRRAPFLSVPGGRFLSPTSGPSSRRHVVLRCISSYSGWGSSLLV